MTSDPRIEKILGYIRELAAGKLTAKVEASDKNDELDAIIIGLGMLGEEIAASMVSQAAYQIKVAELESAIEDVKMLTGLLPMCAWCKKVRDDDGYWQQIEAFVSKHTAARVTHGICPNCRAEPSDV